MPRHKKATQRRRLLVAAALGAAVVGIAGFAWAQGAREGEPDRPAAVEVAATPSAASSTASDPGPDEPEPEPGLSLSAAPTARALTATALRGTASGLSAGASLVVEHQQPDGSWEPFPLPTVIDAGGSFRTYVELGRPGPNRIRVREAASGVTSEPVTITVR